MGSKSLSRHNVFSLQDIFLTCIYTEVSRRICQGRRRLVKIRAYLDLADQLTLFKPGKADYAHRIVTGLAWLKFSVAPLRSTKKMKKKVFVAFYVCCYTKAMVAQVCNVGR